MNNDGLKQKFPKGKDEKNRDNIWTHLSTSASSKEDIIKAMNNDQERVYILTDGMEEFVKKYLATLVTKTQMRTLYEEVKHSENNEKLQIKLIYTAGRIDSKVFKDFILLLIDLIKKTTFGQDFMESALAYHKYHAKK